MRLFSRRNARTNSRRTQLRLQALEDRAVPAFGFGSAFGIGGGGLEYGIGIALDGAGNYYVSGLYQGTVDFDPNHTNPSSNHVLTASGDFANYAAKYSSSGTFLWATDLGPNGQGMPAETISVQGANVIVGFPTATAGGTDNVATVAKLDSATGTISWTTTLTSGGTTAMGVAAGPGDTVYVTGNNSASQAFISRIDSAGNVLWTTTSSGSGTAYGSRLAVDAAGNVYGTGSYTGSVTFGTATKNSLAGTADGLLWKLNANGSVIWVGSMGSNGTDYTKGIVLDGNGNVFMTGGWGFGSTNASNNNNFNPNSGAAVKLTNKGQFDIFIAKLTPAANGGLNLSWAKDIGGTGIDWGQSVAVDAAGNVYSTGMFQFSVNFNPNKGKAKYLAGGGGFVSVLSSSGNFVDAAGFGSSSDGQGRGNGRAIALDGGGNVYVTGVFHDTADFDPTSAVYNLTSNGGVDAFVLKLTSGAQFKQAITNSLKSSEGSDWLAAADSLKPKNTLYAGWLNGN